MKKIKEIKIINQDESTEIANIGADAQNVDYNNTTVKAELDKLNTIDSSLINTQVSQETKLINLQSEVSNLASGSPLVASSTAGMTDTSRVYVNTTDGHWYYYNGTAWVDGGPYQAAEDSKAIMELCNLTANTKNDLEKLTKKIYPNWRLGEINSSGQVVDNQYRIYTSFIEANVNDDLSIKVDANVKYYAVLYNANGAYIDTYGPYTESRNNIVFYSNANIRDSVKKVIIKASYQTGDAITDNTVNNLAEKITITRNNDFNINSKVESLRNTKIESLSKELTNFTNIIYPLWEIGDYYTTNGKFAESSTRIYSEIILADKDHDIDINIVGNIKYYVHFYDGNGTFLIASQAKTKSINNIINTLLQDSSTVKKIRITVSYQNGDEITASNISELSTKVKIKYSEGTTIDSKLITLDNKINNLKELDFFDTIHEKMYSYISGIKFNDELSNPIVDLKKDGDLMTHVSSFVIVDDIVYSVFSVNKIQPRENAQEYTTRLQYFPLSNPSEIEYIDICNIGDDFFGYTVSATCDCCIFKKESDANNLYIVWTIKTNNMWRLVYKTFNLNTKLLSEANLCKFVKDNVEYNFKISDLQTALNDTSITNTDICLMQKISSRIENGEKYYYTGVGITDTCFVIKTKDFINWEYVTKPTFDYNPMWEPVTYVFNNKLYYYCRQEDKSKYGVLAYYDLNNNIWSNPLFIEDAQSRSDFFVFNDKLYLMHAPKNRYHLALLRIDTNNLNKSTEVMCSWVNNYFYPFVQNYNGQLYMTITQNRQHIYFVHFTIDLSDNAIKNKFKQLFLQ